MLRQENHAGKSIAYEESEVRRNPYLADYGKRHAGQGMPRAVSGRERTPGRHCGQEQAGGKIVPLTARNTKRGAGLSPHSAGEEKSGKDLSLLYGGEFVSESFRGRTADYEREAPVRRRRSADDERTDAVDLRRMRSEEYRESGASRRSSAADYEEFSSVRRRMSQGSETTVSGRRPRPSDREAPAHRQITEDSDITRQVRRGTEAVISGKDYTGSGARTRNRGYGGAGTAVRQAPNRRLSSAARARRKRRVMRQRLMVGVWILCAVALGVAFVVRSHRPVPAGSEQENTGGILSGGGIMNQMGFGKTVQGIPESVFVKHPDWEENYLTPNEYSRPGEPLKSVTNIFVHYTANPGTSAAQNRSYFEQQKDTHEASVSAHFIIGYEGEIIQCVPLDEIAYAVMTRNYDSISIECCYLEQDGSFTPETYESLISLLAWLTDAYQLEAEDILRHYDCGGKKCPLYYTEHEDAWEQLKMDVDKL